LLLLGSKIISVRIHLNSLIFFFEKKTQRESIEIKGKRVPFFD
jgi:hypothetical protein